MPPIRPGERLATCLDCNVRMIITDNSIVATQWDGRCYTCFDLAGRVATYLNDLAAFADYKASL